jgi:hypothetical protein
MGTAGCAAGTVEILIVEDSATQAAQLSHHLEVRGYSVRMARNGREALPLALERIPSIIITDVVMPGVDGYTLCRMLKSQAALKDVPVILLTSLSGPHDVLRGLECGADNFIRKPYDAKYLVSQIEYILANRELRRAEGVHGGIQVYFGGQKYFITAEAQQILDLLISTYESAVQVNAELAANQLELTRERDLLHTLMDNVPDWIYFKDVEGRYTAINQAAASALGLATAQQALGRTDADFFDEAHVSRTRADEQAIVATGDPMIAKVEELRLPAQPQAIWVSTTKMVNRDAAGMAIGTFGVSRNITQAKLAEGQIRKANEELEARVAERTAQLAELNRQLAAELAERKRAQQLERETQARFRFLFANNPLPMWVYDRATNRFLEVNDAAVEHYGYSAGEFTSMRVADLSAPEDETAAGSGDIASSGERRHRLKSGRSIDVELTSHSLEWLGRQAVLVVANDITERKRVEREFLVAQKMEAIGRLAAGVAHDFNNLLTVIGGHSAMALSGMEEANPLFDEIREINRAGERAAGLTRQLLAFSKRQILQPRVLKLNQIVADMDRMLCRLIGEDVHLASNLDPDLAPVKADPGQIEQVIMNLAVNARDAMPKGGTLTVETRNVELRKPAGPLRNLRAGDYVKLTVADTGAGMDLETQARIFDPFFTTKGDAGTGLGLSTVYGIVQQSGGGILVFSELGQGTRFEIFLPRAHEAPVQAEAAPATRISGGSETILVVEDEDAVRGLICSILNRQGYTLLRARSGVEALSLSREHDRRIDLMITDVIMPSMSGGELAAEIVRSHPDLKVLFISGYTDDAIVHHGVTERNMAFLGKPFSPEALSRKVRETLDAERQ